MQRRKVLLGLLYLAVGVSIIASQLSDLPEVDWPFLGLFAVAFFALSFRSVEVNDRQFVSSSMMVALTAGVFLGLKDAAPVLSMALLAAAGPISPEDLRRRRVFLPVFNFGQLVASAAAAGWILDVLLPAMSQSGTALRPTAMTIARIVGAASLAALVYTTINVASVQIGSRSVYGNRQVIPWSGMSILLASQISMGVLGGLLGLVLFRSNIGAVPLVLVVYVIGHLVFISYAKLREAHESTLRGFILALEARDLYTRGHTERVAYFCRIIGEQLAFTGTQLERLRWAAIIHDMGKLAVPVEIMQKQGHLTDDEYRELRRAMHRVDDLLSEVDFLRPMVFICSGSHPRLPDEDFGQTGHSHTADPTLEQKVMAVSDAFDAMTSTRGYRMAMSHQRALANLRDDESPLYDDDVVDALEAGLAAVGETYGPPEIRLAEVGADMGRRGA